MERPRRDFRRDRLESRSTLPAWILRQPGREDDLVRGDSPEVIARHLEAALLDLHRLLHAVVVEVIDSVDHAGHHVLGDLPAADVEEAKPLERQLDAPLVTDDLPQLRLTLPLRDVRHPGPLTYLVQRRVDRGVGPAHL